jgi:hypothetical protein
MDNKPNRDPTPMEHALNLIWARLYPGDRDWQYPAEVARHAKLALEETDRVVLALKNASSMIDQLEREHADKQLTLAGEIARLAGELSAVASAIGSDCYLDPPDGGSVMVSEQVRRMAEELAGLRKQNNELNAERATLKAQALLSDRARELEGYLQGVCAAAGEQSYDHLFDVVSTIRTKVTTLQAECDDLRAVLAIERQHRDGHLPDCAGMDLEQGRCGCGYLDGTAYRSLVELLERVMHAPRTTKRVRDEVETTATIDDALLHDIITALTGKPPT